MNKKHLHPEGRPYTKEEFVNRIKTDSEFANTWGDLGPIYGKQWRHWNIDGPLQDSPWYDPNIPDYIDQIQNLINDLKSNPDSRRLIVNAWAVDDLSEMVLPPCHYGFQIYTRELSIEEKEWELEKTNCINDIENDRIIHGHEWENYIDRQYKGIQLNQGIKIPTRAISLMWEQRSVDTFLGLPFNIASYGLLLSIIAKIVNMVPDELIGNLGDTHLYLNHLEQAKEQITRTSFELPNLIINTEFWQTESGECGIPPLTSNVDSIFTGIEITDCQIENYQSHPSIKAPLSN